MLPQITLSLIASLGLAATAPLAAGASQTAFANGPVSLSACTADTTFLPAATLEFGVSRPVTDLHYRFVNNSAVAAQSITVDVSSNGQSDRIVERGTFSPGVPIERTTDATSLIFATGVACRVTQVNFQDGTTWHATGPAKVATGQ